ncbi:uncharacterized protein LOC129592525 [Paramacrobiotus metropolitanus]|uniref:uncharacterized protein LOC129592525 n=1 Tax=Paramacrobiotus metropolitanus TaxID=2943436 RepID=UPI002445B246|nr:uncharacterized protein LOC129592525 [Paramacrobiotus metropolitanus]
MESSESPSEAAHSPPIVYCDENISEEVQLPASLFSASAMEISFGSTSAVSGLPLSADCVEEFVYDLPLPHAYSDRMALALKAYKSGNLSQYAAAKKFKVPYTSLWKKLRGVRTGKKGAHLRKFSEAEEDYIEHLLLKCAENGIPLDKRFLKRIVPLLAKSKDMPEKRKTFTKFWHREFLKRHPKISQRISHGVSRKKAKEWTVENREGWIQRLSELNTDGLLYDPAGIWNFDESAFQVSEKVTTVYAKRGVKEVLSYYDGNDRELITVLAGGNAAGEILRPLILFDGKVVLASRFEGTDDKCYIGFNSSGVMDNSTFTSYIREEVIPKMTAAKNVIFLDGHSSHMFNLEFLSECMKSDKDITVVILPSGQTGKLQPMDIKVYGPVKKYWRDYLRQMTLIPTEEVTKQNFARHIVEKWNDFNMAANIVSGFVSSGIYPFNPDAVCRAYVEPVPSQLVSDLPISIANVYVSELQVVRRSLQKFLF